MTERKPLSISVDMNTDKLQLKLRAIAKHCEELARELDAIDNAVYCPKCGGGDVCTLRVGEDLKLAEASCNDCGYELPIDDDLPLRPEGSD